MEQYTILESGAEGNNQYLCLLLNTSNPMKGKRIRIKLSDGQFITPWLPVERSINIDAVTQEQVGGTTNYSGSGGNLFNLLSQQVQGILQGVANVSVPYQTRYTVVAVRMPVLNVSVAGFLTLVKNKQIVAENIYRPALFPGTASRSASLPFNMSQAAQRMLLPVRRTM